MKFNDENNLDSDFSFLSNDVDFSIEKSSHEESDETNKEKSNTLKFFSEKEIKSPKKPADFVNIDDPNRRESR